MDDKKYSCGCSIVDNPVTDDTNRNETIRRLTDCPYCGTRLANPTELFNHVVMFHSS